MRIRAWAATAVTSAVVLSGCSGGGAPGDADGAISVAPKAPTSEFTVACPQFADPQTDPDEGRLPALSLECLGSQGDPVGISGTPPRPTVVNLWASWCGPCRDEMPVLDEFAAAASGRVDLLGVATSDNRSAATAFSVEFALSFPSVLDPRAKILADQGLQGLPATLLMDQNGVIVYRHIGVYDTLDELKQDVAQHLKVAL